MGRPKKKITKAPLNLTLSPSLIEAAKAYAFNCNESLSELIERLLQREINANSTGINLGEPTFNAPVAFAAGKHAKATVSAKKSK